mmetsp:Transcript_24572/g.56223  ORF Transcript_24572/g.56223 Transcript_24572/m.56223 type:complete len:919 (+) Transcript_24572:629-3385(+)
MLYTSKIYEDQRCKLVKPEDKTAQDEEMHVLSPKLIDAVGSSTQVVWANCQKQEGLLGRSDMRLQTAVGLPVLNDKEGNMCVVVMFSPNIIYSNDEFVAYLQSICRSAASVSIECLLPVLKTDPDEPASIISVGRPTPANPNLGEGVVACCLSFQNNMDLSESSKDYEDHQLEYPFNFLRKDSLDMPKLPSSVDLASMDYNLDDTIASSPPKNKLMQDKSDQASFGLWSAIMNTNIDEHLENMISTDEDLFVPTDESYKPAVRSASAISVASSTNSDMSQQQIFSQGKRDRLEEFIHGFLGISIFEVADIWVPDQEKTFQVLTQVSSSSKQDTPPLEEFQKSSSTATIPIWSGAAGRAYGSGNPVWSNSLDIIVDVERSAAFHVAQIKTVLAVPIFSSNGTSSSAVFCAYSRQRHSSVPFVLRFVQQALRLVWRGLDNVPPTVLGVDTLKDVAPNALGQMAADFEKQAVFEKKRKLSNVSASEKADQNHCQNLDNDNNGNIFAHTNFKERLSMGHNSQPQFSKEHIFPSQPQIEPHLLWRPISTETGTPQIEPHLLCKPISTEAGTPQIGQRLCRPISTEAASTSATKTFDASDPASIAAFWNIQQVQGCQNISGVVPWVCLPTVSSQSAPPDGISTLLMPLQSSIVSTSSPFPSAPSAPGYDTLSSRPTVFSPLFANASTQGLVKPSDKLIHNGWGPKDEPRTSPQSENNVVSGKQPSRNSKGKICRIEGCNDICAGRKPYCSKHCGARQCERSGCIKCAQGSTRFCIAHGGGRRCTYPGCDKGARDKYFCAAHGGGKRCSREGCNKSAVGGFFLCTSHGGGKRCSVEGCIKSAQSTTNFCVRHGGGKKCTHEGCNKVARGRTLFCASHGGGVRCKVDGCNRVAVGKIQLCKGHRDGSTYNEPSDLAVKPFLVAEGS